MEEDVWEPTVVAATVATDGGQTKLFRPYCENALLSLVLHWAGQTFSVGMSKLARVCPGKGPGKWGTEQPVDLGHRAKERPALGPAAALGFLALSARVRLSTESIRRQGFLTELQGLEEHEVVIAQVWEGDKAKRKWSSLRALQWNSSRYLCLHWGVLQLAIYFLYKNSTWQDIG